MSDFALILRSLRILIIIALSIDSSIAQKTDHEGAVLITKRIETITIAVPKTGLQLDAAALKQFANILQDALLKINDAMSKPTPAECQKSDSAAVTNFESKSQQYTNQEEGTGEKYVELPVQTEVPYQDRSLGFMKAMHETCGEKPNEFYARIVSATYPSENILGILIHPNIAITNRYGLTPNNSVITCNKKERRRPGETLKLAQGNVHILVWETPVTSASSICLAPPNATSRLTDCLAVQYEGSNIKIRKVDLVSGKGCIGGKSICAYDPNDTQSNSFKRCPLNAAVHCLLSSTNLRVFVGFTHGEACIAGKIPMDDVTNNLNELWTLKKLFFS